MPVVSRDVIWLLSHIRVISSERRYPSLGDISTRSGTRTKPLGRFRHVTAIPEGAHAGSALVGDERPSSTVHLASRLYLTAESDSAEFTSNPDGPNARTIRHIRQVRIWRVTGIWPAVNNRAWAALGRSADESPPPTAARFAADPPID